MTLSHVYSFDRRRATARQSRRFQTCILPIESFQNIMCCLDYHDFDGFQILVVVLVLFSSFVHASIHLDQVVVRDDTNSLVNNCSHAV